MGELTRRYMQKHRDLRYAVINPPFPRIIKIDIVNTCNYACIFCPQSKQVGRGGEMNDELCRRLIIEGYSEGAREICFSATGEPLLNKNLESYISLAKEIGYEYVFFNTNGLLMTEDRAKMIIKSGVDSVKFSINSSERSYFDVHGAGDYRTVLNNLKSFYELRNLIGSNCKLYVSYVATKYTETEADIVKNDVSEFCDEMIVLNANNRGGVSDEVDTMLYAGEDEYSFTFPCSQIFNNIYVTAEGYMTACCQDFENDMVLADLNVQTLKDAWNGKEFSNFRERFLRRDIDGLMCRNCISNLHEPITPLNPDVKRYSFSERKIDGLKKRIESLKIQFEESLGEQ